MRDEKTQDSCGSWRKNMPKSYPYIFMVSKIFEDENFVC